MRMDTFRGDATDYTSLYLVCQLLPSELFPRSSFPMGSNFPKHCVNVLIASECGFWFL